MGYLRLTRREGLLAALVVALSMVVPEGRKFPKLCVFNRLTGLPCPACGLTRSFVGLGHGDLGTAINSHLLGPFAYALMMGTATRLAVKPRAMVSLTRWLWAVAVIVVLLA